MRPKLIAGNWKMNHTVPEALHFVERLKPRLRQMSCEVVLAPPFTALWPLKKALEGTAISLAGQNLYCKPKGAFTGEISPGMLKDCGCRYVILGHSERRHLFHESDSLINEKIKIALQFNLEVIFCVGETEEQRAAGETERVISDQLHLGLEGIPTGLLPRLTTAYEPVWAIGTGKNATPEQAQAAHRFIREWTSNQFGPESAQALRILYGGSVTPENASSLMGQADVDGVLVGSASLDADSFYAIISSVT